MQFNNLYYNYFTLISTITFLLVYWQPENG